MAELQGRKAAFLDRDGVINVDHGYTFRWSEFVFCDNAVAALRQLADLGYLLVVITNQSGIGRGYYTEADFQLLTRCLSDHLVREEGIELAATYFCPHHPEAALGEFRRRCDCRKPAPGMILRAIKELGIEPASSVLVGDKESDIQAGRAAGVGRLFHVTTSEVPDDVMRVDSLMNAADWLSAESV